MADEIRTTTPPERMTAALRREPPGAGSLTRPGPIRPVRERLLGDDLHSAAVLGLVGQEIGDRLVIELARTFGPYGVAVPPFAIGFTVGKGDSADGQLEDRRPSHGVSLPRRLIRAHIQRAAVAARQLEARGSPSIVQWVEHVADGPAIGAE